MTRKMVLIKCKTRLRLLNFKVFILLIVALFKRKEFYLKHRTKTDLVVKSWDDTHSVIVCKYCLFSKPICKNCALYLRLTMLLIKSMNL